MKKGEEQGRITILEDLVWEILSRVPVKSLLRFMCVCKSWYDIMRNRVFMNRVFIRKHLQITTENNNPLLILDAVESSSGNNVFYTVDSGFPSRAKKLDFPFKSYLESVRDVVLVGSCNGLVCLNFTPQGGEHGLDTCLWNPATGEGKFLPVSGFTSNLLCMGLGFDSISDDYKVVRVVYSLDNKKNKKNDVRVYSLSSDEWRRLGSIPYCIDESMATIVNGIPHWIARPENESRRLLICFDCAREVFEEMPEPNYYAYTFENETCLKEKWIVVLEGCLSVFCYFSDRSLVNWVMKDYGLKESWMMQFVFRSRTWTHRLVKQVRPLGIWSCGRILLLKDFSSLVLYDTKRNCLTQLEIEGLPQILEFQAFYHVESLVPLVVPNLRNMSKVSSDNWITFL